MRPRRGQRRSQNLDAVALDVSFASAPRESNRLISFFDRKWLSIRHSAGAAMVSRAAPQPIAPASPTPDPRQARLPPTSRRPIV